MTTGADWDYRLYAPGQPHYGNITLRARVGKDSKELYQWWLDTSRGQGIRKSISVILLKRDGTEARRYNFHECFPTRYTPFEYDGVSGYALETADLDCDGLDVRVDGNRKALLQWITEVARGKDIRKTITVTEDQTHQYVTAIIKVRAKKVIVVTTDGEIIHDSDFNLARTLR